MLPFHALLFAAFTFGINQLRPVAFVFAGVRYSIHIVFCRLLAVVCSAQSTVLAAWNGVLTTTTYGTRCRDVAAIRV
jgi:hypothetical protein